MLQLKNGIDPFQIHPDTAILDVLEDTGSATLPALGVSSIVASRSNLGGTLTYTSNATSPQWCMGIFNIKQKQATMQSIALRMLVNGMSVAEDTLDFNVMNNIFIAQWRYLNPFLLFPKVQCTLGIWAAANGNQITNMDGSCEIRLFARS
jgi:hypothetical protein